MISAINKVFDLLYSVWEFVKMIFTGLLDLIRYLTNAVIMLPGLLSWLPPVLLTGLLALISIQVIYKILGRDK